jgi:hypothetical protein
MIVGGGAMTAFVLHLANMDKKSGNASALPVGARLMQLAGVCREAGLPGRRLSPDPSQQKWLRFGISADLRPMPIGDCGD